MSVTPASNCCSASESARCALASAEPESRTPSRASTKSLVVAERSPTASITVPRYRASAASASAFCCAICESICPPVKSGSQSAGPIVYALLAISPSPSMLFAAM